MIQTSIQKPPVRYKRVLVLRRKVGHSQEMICSADGVGQTHGIVQMVTHLDDRSSSLPLLLSSFPPLLLSLVLRLSPSNVQRV